MPTEVQYDDPRLVTIYDALNPWGADTDHYLALAGNVPIRILDVGCGTGLLTCALAERGHDVIGLDPAERMLEVAQTRPGGDRVRWLCGAAQDAPGDSPFDLVLMTGHAFQVLMTDAETLAALAVIRSATKPGGRFAFESRNPAIEAWRTWTPQASRRRVVVSGTVSVDTWHEVIKVDGDVVTFDSFYRLGKDLVTSRGTLRFPGRATITGLLGKAGFATVDWRDDWATQPTERESPELIAVAS